MDATSLSKEGNIGYGSLDAQDNVELVVHLDRDGAHPMANTAALKPHIEAIAHLVLIVSVQLATQKGGDVGGFDRLNQGFQEKRVEGL